MNLTEIQFRDTIFHMTKPEKISAILTRLKKDKEDIKEEHISSLVVAGYLDDLAKAGVIESAFAMTPLGSNVRAICEEFDWKPSDEEIIRFVSEMVEEKERAGFLFILKKYRDDRNGLLTEFKKVKDGMSEE